MAVRAGPLAVGRFAGLLAYWARESQAPPAGGEPATRAAMKTPVSALFETEFVRPKPGRSLVVGSRIYREREDRRRRYPDAVGIDQSAGEGVDWVIDLEKPLPPGIGTFEHVDCLSVLEHSKRPWLLAANLERLMRPGATLFVQAPFVWRTHLYPDDNFRFTPSGIRCLFPGLKWKKLSLVNWRIEAGDKLSAQTFDGWPYFPRTEVCGFAVKPFRIEHQSTSGLATSQTPGSSVGASDAAGLTQATSPDAWPTDT